MKVSRPIYRRAPSVRDENNGCVRLGQRVRHGKFGEGVVLNSEGSGSHARVQVNFEGVGTKWLVVAYANLELM
jgi:DNA helicase-2/ATP-dependent DNA helicase PcrA